MPGYAWNEINAEALNALVDTHVTTLNAAAEGLKKVLKAEGCTEAEEAVSKASTAMSGGGLALYLMDPENQKLIKGGAEKPGGVTGVLLSMGQAIGVASKKEEDPAAGTPAYKMHQAFLRSFTGAVSDARKNFGNKVLFPYIMADGVYAAYWIMSLKAMLTSDHCSRDLYDSIKFSYAQFSSLMEEIPRLKEKYNDPYIDKKTIQMQVEMDVVELLKGKYSALGRFIKPQAGAIRIHDLANVVRCVDNSTKKFYDIDKRTKKLYPLVQPAEQSIVHYKKAAGSATDMLAARVINAEFALAQALQETITTASQELADYRNPSTSEAPYCFMTYEPAVESVARKYNLFIPGTTFEVGTFYYDQYEDMADRINAAIKA